MGVFAIYSDRTRADGAPLLKVGIVEEVAFVDMAAAHRRLYRVILRLDSQHAPLVEIAATALTGVGIHFFKEKDQFFERSVCLNRRWHCDCS